MIKVRYTKNSVVINGHAGYAEHGKDIICASVSSIITTSVNNMKVIDEEACDYNDNGSTVIIKVENDELILKLFNNLILLLKNLANDYPKNVKVESEE